MIGLEPNQPVTYFSIETGPSKSGSHFRPLFKYINQYTTGPRGGSHSSLYVGQCLTLFLNVWRLLYYAEICKTFNNINGRDLLWAELDNSMLFSWAFSLNYHVLISVYRVIMNICLICRSPCMNACSHVVNITLSSSSNIHYIRTCIHTWWPHNHDIFLH